MSEVAILVTRPGTLTRKARKTLEDNDVVIVETDAPQSVRFITPQAELSGSELLLIALIALDNSYDLQAKAKMVSTMRRMLEEKSG